VDRVPVLVKDDLGVFSVVDAALPEPEFRRLVVRERVVARPCR
jgi:hypothetical protein